MADQPANETGGQDRESQMFYLRYLCNAARNRVSEPAPPSEFPNIGELIKQIEQISSQLGLTPPIQWHRDSSTDPEAKKVIAQVSTQLDLTRLIPRQRVKKLMAQTVNHAIWHGFVLAGTGCHFLAVWHEVVPMASV